MLTLYEGCFSSSLGECNGKRCSCLSRPYYDGIIVIHKPSKRELIHDGSEPGSQTADSLRMSSRHPIRAKR